MVPCLVTTLVRTTPILIASLFGMSLALSLVPSPLLEFRYFIIPYYLYRIMIARARVSAQALVLELLYFGFVDLVTVYTFGWLPRWSPEGLVRFMW